LNIEGGFILKQIFKKGITSAAVVVMGLGIVLPITTAIAAPYTTGWAQSNGKWYYYNSNGKMVTNTWAKDSSGRWFYLDCDGKMLTNGWAQDSSKRWFYLGSDGAMATNSWAKDASKNWFYLGSDGAMVTSSWVEYNGKSYYLNSGGDMAYSTTTPDGSSVDSTGAKVTSGTQPGGQPPDGSQPGGPPPDGGNSGAAAVNTGTGAYNLADGETLSGGTYTSTNADENAVRASGRLLLRLMM
jgi:hypothetical protein